MSPLWADRWRIGLAPQAAEAVRLPRARVGARCRVQQGTPQQPPWQPALNALDRALEELGAAKGSAEVVLSNHFVRYLSIPWQPALNSLSELEELAQLQMRQVFGDVAARWTVRCSEGAYGRPSLACAVDSELIAALSRLLAARRIRLRSLQPLLMAAGNRYRGSLGREAAFAVVEQGRVCLALLRGGSLHAVVSRRTGPSAALVVERELSALAVDHRCDELALLRVGEAPRWPGGATVRVRELSAEPQPLATCGVD